MAITYNKSSIRKDLLMKMKFGSAPISTKEWYKYKFTLIQLKIFGSEWKWYLGKDKVYLGDSFTPSLMRFMLYVILSLMKKIEIFPHELT